MADSAITSQAITALNELNRAVALDDAFARRADEFVQGLQSPPALLTRKPALPDHITFYRARDVLAIHLDGRFHAAYVHELARINECPIIEFYAQAFDHLPTLDELESLPAQVNCTPKVGHQANE
ncbi:MAG: hypothetical protein GAK43_02322 [Stenotrophomonas maltophilia]|nr:MAG: hypothetical protein GAK43_02322 [Stenotrophomonas maltophilia]